jgi:hypothetical protein
MAVAPAQHCTTKKEAFLDLLADGQTVMAAAEEVQVPRRTIYSWRAADHDFAAAWELAYEQGTDKLERVAQERAINGSDLLLIFLLKGRRPHVYRDNVRHEVDARLTVTVEDARAELEDRIAAIDGHRAALPRTVGAD